MSSALRPAGKGGRLAEPVEGGPAPDLARWFQAGALVDGDAETVAEVNDLWTFARDIRSRDPNWKLIATESEG